MPSVGIHVPLSEKRGNVDLTVGVKVQPRVTVPTQEQVPIVGAIETSKLADVNSGIGE
jgi:hypothetical protein